MFFLLQKKKLRVILSFLEDGIRIINLYRSVVTFYKDKWINKGSKESKIKRSCAMITGEKKNIEEKKRWEKKDEGELEMEIEF